MNALITQRIGDLIRRERINQNLSIRALADFCHISHSYLADIEKGEVGLTDEIRQIIFQELDIKSTVEQQIASQEDVQKKLNIFFDYVYFQDNVKVELEFKNLLQNRITSGYPSLEIEYMLIDIIFYLSYKKITKTFRVL